MGPILSTICIKSPHRVDVSIEAPIHFAVSRRVGCGAEADMEVPKSADFVAKVAERAARLGIPVSVVAGRVELSTETLAALGVSQALALASDGVTPERAMRDVELLLERAAEALVRALAK